MKQLRSFSVLLLILILQIQSFANVGRNDLGTVFLDFASSTSTDLTTLTVSAGSNLCLLAFLSIGTGSSATTVTWDSAGTPQVMTSRGSSNNGGYIEVFSLVAPHTGNLNLHATWTGASSGVLGAIALSGADQSTCVKTADTVTNTGNSGSPSTGAVTSTSDGMTVGASSNASANYTTPITQTVVYSDNNRAVAGAVTTALGGTSNTHSWTLSASGLWAAVGVHVLAASTGIAVDSAYSSGYKTASSSYTIPSMNCGGSNRVAYVGVSMLSVAGSSVTSVTDSDGSFTRIGFVSSVTGAVRVELWRYIAPSTGAMDVTVALSAALDSAAGAVCLTGVHQTSPDEGEDTNSATNVGATDATVPIVTVADNDFIVAIVATDDTAITAGQTSQYNTTGTLGSGAAETFGPQTPAGSKTMSYTAVGALATWSMVGVGVRAVGDAALVSNGRMTILGVQ